MMRAAFLILLVLPTWARGQADSAALVRPFVLQQAVGLTLSRTQIYDAALDAWGYTFGQEPGARLDEQDKANGKLQGTARFNYRGSQLTAREQTLGVITYHIQVQAENGLCRVRITQAVHTGNRNAPGGGIDLGPIYEGDRPRTRIRGISLGTASVLHADMRTQLAARLTAVMNAFAARMRLAATPGR